MNVSGRRFTTRHVPCCYPVSLTYLLWHCHHKPCLVWPDGDLSLGINLIYQLSIITTGGYMAAFGPLHSTYRKMHTVFAGGATMHEKLNSAGLPRMTETLGGNVLNLLFFVGRRQSPNTAATPDILLSCLICINPSLDDSVPQPMQQKDICRITFITHYGPEKSMKMSVPISLFWWIKTITQLIYGQFTQTTPVFCSSLRPINQQSALLRVQPKFDNTNPRITRLAFSYQNRGPKNTDLPDNTKRCGFFEQGDGVRRAEGIELCQLFFF